MQTIKNQVAQSVMLFLAAVTLFAACTPPGPRALLRGQALLEKGQYPPAIERLRTATELMPTNALAFNLLGLAYHQAGRLDDADQAYLRALALNHDFPEAHYNLGRLRLDQNRLDQAKSELTTFALRRGNSPEGWLKLGIAQLRSSAQDPAYARAADLASAERSFDEVLRLTPHNAEAWMNLGLARLQRNRPAEAAQDLVRALKEQPNYPPALLNLAIIAQEHLKDRRLALQEYRQYAALKPPPDNLQAVRAIIRQLEQDDASPPPQPRPAATNAPAVSEVPAPRPPPQPQAPEPQRQPLPSHLATSNAPRSVTTPKPEITEAPRPAPPPAAAFSRAPPSNPPPRPNFESVKLAAEPVFKPATDVPPPAYLPQPSRAGPVVSTSSVPASAAAQAAKRSLLKRLNPVNLFTGSSKPKPSAGSGSAAAESSRVAMAQLAAEADAADTGSLPPNLPRYSYKSPAHAATGNRAQAERLFTSGVQAHQAQHLAEAIQAYREAAAADPAFYDAQYNLGLAAFATGDLPLALQAYETALAIRPESVDARVHFALTLKQAGYLIDAINEFDRILLAHPNESRAHLALGNLYAQQLRQPAKARPHYLEVLVNDPGNSQADAIRYWLDQHPK